MLGLQPRIHDSRLDRHPRGGQRVEHQHRHSQWPDTTWHRRDCPGNFCHSIKINVPDKTVIRAIDADINNGRSRLDHLGCDHRRATDRGHRDVC